MEEQGLRMFENKVLGIFESNKDEVTEGRRNYIMRSFVICTLRQTLLG
jgi:hypothetical protein